MKSPSLLHLAKRLAAAGPETRRFAARAWLGAPFVQASLSLWGFAPTLRWVEALSRKARRTQRRPLGVEQGEALVRGVFRRHFVRGACLPQSLLQYWLHRRDGLPVRLVVGVRRAGDDASTPVEAHAWVEAAEPREATFAPLFVSEGGAA